ncbi:unnamed protein product [Calypogeia fissa]
MAFSGRAMVVALLLVILGVHSASAVQYTVGGSSGWTYQTGSNSVYTDQFKSITLVVGDVLFFPFVTQIHNVYEIPPADLATCDFSNPIGEYTATNATVPLTTAGVHAFACEIPSHCSQFGMQLSVTVAAGAPVAAPVSPPTTPPVTPPAPVATPPAPAPAKAVPAPAPTKTVPAPAPTTTVPAPAPTTKAPAPSKTPTKAPTKAPSPSTGAPSTIPEVSAPAPSPASPGQNSGSITSTGSAMVVAVVVAAFAFMLV